jgi:hypothetical protein
MIIAANLFGNSEAKTEQRDSGFWREIFVFYVDE